MKNKVTSDALFVVTSGLFWRRVAVALTSFILAVSAVPGVFASQLVLNSTGGTMTLGTDVVLTGSSVSNPSGFLSLDCSITSVGGSTTLTYTCTGGSVTFQSNDGTVSVAGTFGAAALYLSAAGGGKGGNIKYYYSFYGSFTGTQTTNGVSAAISGETNVVIAPRTSQIGSGSATACCAATGINSAYTPLYVTDYSNSQLVRSDDLWGTNKQVLGSTGTGIGHFDGPQGVAVDASGRIYVADTFNCRIVRVDNIAGTHWTNLGGQCGSGVRQFSGATDIAVDSSGKIYVADADNSRIIRVDDMLGTNWTSFGTSGSGINQLIGARGVAVDAAGKIYIADTGNNRLVRIDDMTGTNWTVLTQSPVINGYIYSFGAPAHVALDPVGRVVVGGGTTVIRVDDMTGANWAELGVGTTVQGISIDSAGTTFLAGTGLALFDDVITGAGFNTSAFVATTGGVYAIPVPNPVPAVTVAPSSLAFGKQNIGTASASQNIVLKNFGEAPLVIANIGIAGDFAQSNTCGTSLPGGSSCTIAVAYTPLVTGPETGAVTITDNAFTGTQTVALTGTGTAPVAATSPGSMTFEPQAVNSTSGGELVFLSNTGTGPLTFSGSGIGVSGDFAQTSDCGTAVAPAAVCAITVTFTPTATGTRTGTLSIASNAVQQNITLNGTGVSSAPTVTAAPESLVFSTQLINTTSPAQTVTLTNSGPKAVSLATPALSGDFATTGTCPANLGAGKSCKLSVTFTPAAAGIRTGSLTFTLASGPITLALTGTGVSSATGWLTVSPTPVVFNNGYVVGDNPTQFVTVTNTNGVPAGIAQIRLTGSPAFTRVDACGATLAAYASCHIAITFAPKIASTFAGTLIVTESAGIVHRIPVSGTASSNSGGGN